MFTFTIEIISMSSVLLCDEYFCRTIWFLDHINVDRRDNKYLSLTIVNSIGFWKEFMQNLFSYVTTFMHEKAITQRYSWTTAKVGVKHKSTYQSIKCINKNNCLTLAVPSRHYLYLITPNHKHFYRHTQNFYNTDCTWSNI